MDKFTEMEQIQNVETLCQRSAILSDFSLNNITYNSCEKKNPKDVILIWDTGASFGLTPFWSDFIDCVEADIHLKDVTKINWVIGIGTTLHKFQNDQGKDIFLRYVLYHIPTTDVCLFSAQTFHQMHGIQSRMSAGSLEMYCKVDRIVVSIWRE